MRCYPNISPAEKPLRFDRMSGMDEGQLDELERRFESLLEAPWDSETGRPKDLTLREAIIVACGYARHNIIEDVLAEIFDTSQPTISRVITEITPLIAAATAGFRPSAEEARAAVRGQTVLENSPHRLPEASPHLRHIIQSRDWPVLLQSRFLNNLHSRSAVSGVDGCGPVGIYDYPSCSQ